MLTSQRQFIAGPAVELGAGVANSIRIGESFRLIRSRNLNASRCSNETAEIIVLGQIIDPANPAHDNNSVTNNLLFKVSSFSDFEAQTSELAGRWIAFVCIDHEWRVYPDACGTRTVYYTNSSDGKLGIGSQPELLCDFAGVDEIPELRQAFMEQKHHAASWPLALTPFQGVKQLLPNHYLRLRDGAALRFWPTENISFADPETAVNTVVNTLHNTIKALTYRGRPALPLTGGYDSRTLLACSKELLSRLTLVRVTGYHLPFYDSALPRVLARRVNQRINTIHSQPESADIGDAVSRNTGGMWWDPADYMIHSFHRISCDFLLLGQISEITRCFYYPSGEHPPGITPELLAQLAYYNDNSLAIGAFAEWLEEMPIVAKPYLLDLLYWEHRVGNWAANLANALDTFYEPVFPYNCRRALTTMLGTPVEFRKPPYGLHRRVCSEADPRLDGIPFNESCIDRITESHWRLRRMMQMSRKFFSKF